MSITDFPTDLTAIEQVVEVPLAAIRPAPDNPRATLGDLTGLADSIRSAGVLQPVTITPRPEDGQPPYMMVLGHRRQAGSDLAGKTSIPAIIREMTEAERIAAMHIENMNRTDLKPTEEAVSLKALKDLGMSERDIAEQVGRSQPYVNKRLSLLGLPDDVKTELDGGRMSVENALALAKVKDEKKIADILKRCRRLNDDGKTPFYEGIGVAVSQHLDDVKRDKEVRQIERSLRAEGVTVIDYPANNAWTGKARRLGDGHNEVHVDVAKHAKKPCHAAAVKRTTAEVVYVCTDYQRHEPKPGKAAKPDQPTAPPRVADTGGSEQDIAAERERAEVEAWNEYRRREAEREQAELAAAAERRHEFIGSLVRGKHNKNDVLTVVLNDYLEVFLDGGVFSERALAFLGTDLPDNGDTYTALRAYAGQSLANLTRAAFALRLDEIESRVHGFVAFLDSDVRKHYAFLIANGFDPSDVEKRGIDRAEAQRAALAATEPADGEQADVEQAEGEESAQAEGEQTEGEQTEGEQTDDAKEGDAA